MMMDEKRFHEEFMSVRNLLYLLGSLVTNDYVQSTVYVLEYVYTARILYQVRSE